MLKRLSTLLENAGLAQLRRMSKNNLYRNSVNCYYQRRIKECNRLDQGTWIFHIYTIYLFQSTHSLDQFEICMLVKKGQNSKIIIYMTRQWYIHQDLCIYIKIHIYTLRFAYIHQDSCIYIKIRVYTSRFIYTSRFAYIHQDLHIYIKIRVIR